MVQHGVGNSAYGFAGEQYDSATSLLYLRARYYNPALKVFQSRDPWQGSGWRPDTLNYYTYAQGNPVLYTDPSGEICWFGLISTWPGRPCSERERQYAIEGIALLGGFVSSPAFATGFLVEFVDSMLAAGPSTAAGVLQVILEDTAIGQHAATSMGLALSNCSLDPDVVTTLLSPYTSVVNNPDPYFQLGRWTGRATALALAVGETVGGASTVVLSVVGAGPTGGAALLATPAAAKVTAHGALVIGAVIAKERADPLLLRLPVLFAAAQGGADGQNGGSDSSGGHAGGSSDQRPTNKRGEIYPEHEVEGYGKVPFPEGQISVTDPNPLRAQYTDSLRQRFRQWWYNKYGWFPTPGEYQIHHIKPLSRGGTNDFENLVPLRIGAEHQQFTNWWRYYP